MTLATVSYLVYNFICTRKWNYN
uniref:Uncharacterized protein n=1 Tax=Arundo donax TaxID=35708 RepID=A0A0A8Z092_ARUDO